MVKGNNVLRMAGVALAVAVAGLAGCNGAVYYHEAPPPHAPAYGYRWNAYRVPSADNRARLQDPQNGSVTEDMKPISPCPSRYW